MLKTSFVALSLQFICCGIVSANSQTGEEIYSAVFFQTGPTYSRLNEFISEKKSQTENIDANAQRQIIAQIKKSQSDFFERFNIEMTSGNPERVRNAYNDGLKQMNVSLTEISNTMLSKNQIATPTFSFSSSGTSSSMSYSMSHDDAHQLNLNQINSSALAKDVTIIRLTKALSTTVNI